ncbi:MAG: PHP domain-containing protein [Actinobacteria bacterium]|nr:PHP domain-containing protein [Actinomycetota bacterium]
MIVDLHVHTNHSSFCSQLSPGELLVRAKMIGLDAVAVTEHSVYSGAHITCEMGLAEGFRVFKGVEVYTTGGDMLVFGTEVEVCPDMEFEELLQAVREVGGVIVAAHPTRGYWGHHRKYKGFPPREVLERVDAIETLNGGCSYQENVQATRLATELGLPQVGGSDAHSVSQVGRCVTVFPRPIQGDDELARFIREGECVAAYLDGILTLPDTVSGE